ncbi:hypothetical protein KHA94_24075 [Bacillus sp. FJAT-49705]|uniref:YhfM-like domain-containing protein n=1 Tax=Cytobacillus citreus TaxID=2833586 RepID=A0ABS5NZA4_9BACI|nr:hypothetical protein [Cytobacillus citreus]MBS4193177.1 hypothetical protein [Cytobacillus citreus]
MMKKWALFLIGIVIVIISGFAIFSNGFSNIESIKVQKFDKDTNEFDEGKVIKDSSSLKTFTKILNRANHERNVFYKMAYPEDYKVTLTYEDDTIEELYVWIAFGNSTFIKRPTKNDVFRIKNDSHRKEILELLD